MYIIKLLNQSPHYSPPTFHCYRQEVMVLLISQTKKPGTTSLRYLGKTTTIIWQSQDSKPSDLTPRLLQFPTILLLQKLRGRRNIRRKGNDNRIYLFHHKLLQYSYFFSRFTNRDLKLILFLLFSTPHAPVCDKSPWRTEVGKKDWERMQRKKRNEKKTST